MEAYPFAATPLITASDVVTRVPYPARSRHERAPE